MGPDDGVDSRQLARKARKTVSGHKTLRLARQIERTLELELMASEHATLRGLRVVSVAPNPDAHHFLVTVTPSDEATRGLERGFVLGALASVVPALRNAVAESIHRKRVPDLAFAYMPDTSTSSPGELPLS